MKPKLLVEISSLSQGKMFIKQKVDALVLNIIGLTYTKQFNCYTDEIRILADEAQKNQVELYINLDMLYHEDDIIGLKAILKKLAQMEITGLIISDVGLIELTKELGLTFSFINGGAILNTNYESINCANNIYDGCYLSNEINIDEILKIAQNTQTKLFVQVFGKQKIFSSKRKLLTSYLNYYQIKNIDVSPRNYLVISDPNEKDNQSYIYEDQCGTYVYTKKNVNALKYLRQLEDNQVTYLYLNNLFCTNQEYGEIVKIFKEVIDNPNYDLEVANQKLQAITKELGESFYNDKTVFTIEQAKLLEMGLKND